jgi:hypothetical protein
VPLVICRSVPKFSSGFRFSCVGVCVVCVLLCWWFETIPGGIKESFFIFLNFYCIYGTPFLFFRLFIVIEQTISHHEHLESPCSGVHSFAASASGVFKSWSVSQLYVVIGTEMTATKIRARSRMVNDYQPLQAFYM